MKYLVALLLVALPALAQEPLKDYRPLAGIMLCEDVKLPCQPMMQKDTPIFVAVYSLEGKLIAITKLVGDRETVIWGELKLPLKPTEKEL